MAIYDPHDDDLQEMTDEEIERDKVNMTTEEILKQRILQLEQWCRRIVFNVHEPDKWPIEFRHEFMPATASKYKAAKELEGSADQALIKHLLDVLHEIYESGSLHEIEQKAAAAIAAAKEHTK